MDHESLDDWIISLLSNHTIRQIAQLVHVSVNRVRAVRNGHLSGAKLFHRLGAPCKATPEIKQPDRAARSHTSTQSLNALFEVCNVYPSWPPNSPDLTPVESLWGAIKRRVQWSGIQTREHAIEIIQRYWSEFAQRSINSLVAGRFSQERIRYFETSTLNVVFSHSKPLKGGSDL
jgi:transposase